ncbi:MAG: ABC transporter ATP-binding protein [Chloroflexi bacterium]|nr:ABC transporter ATP-binding protein [Chloroflexota bacterium]MXX80040.1 ABC transporter ATP-binding protein [Chloroflexota bacterium]MYD16918.1 ABC transporter ATP-binding protein [Chloroflexota bacterium]MYF21924.1 ABC transporter ATP-binding protein [Chloroflexota bacterium]MYJ02470.1 ABC transporter ATP-binding protein [Chloroflexota bacterium]
MAAYRTTDTLKLVPSPVHSSIDSELPAQLSAAGFEWPGGRGVSDIDLQVRRGETVTLLGPNGAGKSTILKMLSGEIAPQRGGVAIFGSPHGAAARRQIGLVLQEPSTDDLMTVQETLLLHGRLFGLPRVELSRRCDDILSALDIADRAGDRCETLSGGLRRRLDIARALLHDPELLLLDEPTLALDPESSAAIWYSLQRRAAAGVAIVVCSNDTAEAEANADRVVIISDGRVLADDTPQHLTSALKHDALELDWPSPSDHELSTLASWDGVGAIASHDGALHLTVDSSAEIVPLLFQHFGSRISGIRIRESSLRDAWFQIVGLPLDEHPTQQAAARERPEGVQQQ